MIVYHGTTTQRARQISTVGFVPRKPSRRVWFAESRAYALGRAKTQAKRTHDTAVVLTCEMDLAQMRKRLGGKKVFHGGGVIAIKSPVSVSVLRSHPGYPGYADVPTSPADLAAWVNDILGLKPYKKVDKRHPGIDRLCRWVVNRMTSRPDSRLRSKELLGAARRWLPEHFKGVRIDPDTMHTRREVATMAVVAAPPPEAADPREDEALDCLVSEKPERRARGLGLLAELGDPDLFEWCAMFLSDESTEVTVAVLHTVLCCEDADLDLLAPFAESDNKLIRGAATAALAKHAGEKAAHWLERGLKDPESCVRMEAAALLSEVDPVAHRSIFHLALSDPNPVVVRRAHRHAAGKGYPSDWHQYGERDSSPG